VFVPIRQAADTTLWKSRYEAGNLPCTLTGPADLRFGPGQAHFIAFIGLDRLQALLPADTAEILECFAACRSLPAGPEAAAQLAQRLGAMIRGLQLQPDALRYPEAVWSFQDDLVTALAAAVEPPARKLGRPRRAGRAAGLRRAMEFLQHHGPVGIGVPDLASAAAVSPRTLERAFQESFDITVRDYLRLQRLHAVRRDLIFSRKGEVQVSEVAWRHGFYELGRFALEYARWFGERPSETLARVPAARDVQVWR
jgi:AraC-like DNA-binding protein